MHDNDHSPERLLASVKRIELFVSILVRQSLKEAFESELADDKSRQVYELTGAKTTREIAEATGLGLATISKMWNRWESIGLVVKDGQRFRRTFEDSNGAHPKATRDIPDRAVVTDNSSENEGQSAVPAAPFDHDTKRGDLHAG